MSSPPTLQDIADRLGLGLSTVSMALNDSPRLAAGTKEKVRRMAEEMGYRRNPAFAAVGSRARWAKSVEAGTPLVLVDELPPDGFHYALFDEVLKGMRLAGGRLGYAAREHIVRDAGEWERLPRMLRAQGVAGVVFGQVFDAKVLENPAWRHFALVAAGVQTNLLPLHTVRFSRFRGARDTVRELAAKGFRRMAWLEGRHTHFASEEDEDRWAGVRVGLREAGLEPDVIPPLVHAVGEPLPVKKICAWLRRHKPDVLLSTLSWDVYSALGKAGWRIPEDFAFACLVGGIPQAHHMLYPRSSLGERAVEWIDTQLRHGEYGLPSAPRDLLVHGEWRVGV